MSIPVNVRTHEGRRAKLARWTCKTGGVRLLEWVMRRPGLTVIGYHRIGDSTGSPYDPAVFDCTPEQLDQHIPYLKSHFHVVELEEAQELIARPERLRHPHVLLTFDDGYVDNYEVAFPILKSHDVQGTFFLPTAFVGTSNLMWSDKIAFMVRASKKDRIVLEYPNKQIIERLTADSPSDAIREILQAYKSVSATNGSRFLACLADACAVAIPETAPDRLFMNWQEAQQMISGGMAVGSHTHSHPILTQLPFEQQLSELTRSRQILESNLGIRADALAYPVGSRTSFSTATWDALQKAGYRTAFSYSGGTNLPGSIRPFDVRRIGVYQDQSFSSFRVGLTMARLTGAKSF
jgi:peptidoglycan/xylan/chitin deacetylase (PgdA/CDA1 family)